MKKLQLSLITLFVTATASAMTVSQAVKIDTDGPAHNPVINPNGQTILFSSDNHTGLKSVTLGQQGVKTIAEAPGAGFQPIFSTDGTKVFYQTATLIEGLLSRGIQVFDTTTGQTKQLSNGTRENLNINEISGKTDYVFADYDKIMIVKGGKAVKIDPIEGSHSYLWASLSPDGSKLLFVEPFKGVFVSELDGSNPVKIAKKGDFPAWASNNLITFVESHDDGYVILDSTLKVYDLTTGITANLTSDKVLVGESCAAANGNVVYTTLDGDLFLINVK